MYVRVIDGLYVRQNDVSTPLGKKGDRDEVSIAPRVTVFGTIGMQTSDIGKNGAHTYEID